MQYASFKIEDEKKINDFLKKNSEKIGSDGVLFSKDRISFIYSDMTKEQEEQKAVEGAIRGFIGQRLSEIMGHEVDENYYRGLSLKGEKTAGRVVDSANMKMNVFAQVRYARELLKQVQDGTWPALTAAKDSFKE